MKNGIYKRIYAIFFLQGAVFIYSLTTVISKLVSDYKFLSKEFILLYILDFAVLGIYAILWQQLLKRFELSIAYANKAMTLLWSLLWSVLLFRENISPSKIIGVFLVIVGTIILNAPGNTKSEFLVEKSESNSFENRR
ncbi:EamA family transporter [Butyrivibrio sp. NC2002]|uniref:EamA family transporter n=1 Tax=Butyrivibrio sp. NC2002 TaxID=1410610 RepID=UPI000568BF43|nr:EamA family transporter [Butyrivibrio sp. NC2002]